MYRSLLALTVGLTIAAAASAAQAQDRWVQLGTHNVILKAGEAAIDVAGGPGRSKAVRVIAERRGIDIKKVQIVYADGSVHNEDRRINLLTGINRSRAINPTERGKFIDKVIISFEPQLAIVPVRLVIEGLQSDAGSRATRTGTPVAASPGGSGTIAGTATAPIATAARPGQPTDSGDVLFGSHTVGFGIDKDVLKVGADIGKFDRIRFRVLDNDIKMKSAKVNFADGSSEEIAFNRDVRANTRTDWFQLKGDKFIRSIDLLYASRPNFNGKAYVEVYGQYAEGWLGPQGEGRKYNGGWVLLGAQTANFILDRSDVIKVGRNEGGFRALEVRVRDEAITLRDVRVTYGNGEVDAITVPADKRKVDAGTGYGPIVLKGGTRVIQEIRPTYRTRYFQKTGLAKTRATVEFWGQH